MNAEDQHADSPNQPKSRSGPQSLRLSRCAGCYNQEDFMRRRGADGESSSSAEDSGPELDCESETESSSSSSCSEKAVLEISEEPEEQQPSDVARDAAEPESGGKDGDGREEMGETLESQEGKSRTKLLAQRAPLVKSFSLPASFAPHLIPLSLLPRPHTVVSTLHLQVLSQKHDDDALDIVEQHLPERDEDKTGQSTGGGHNLLPPQMGLPWQQGSQPTLEQHQLSYQYHHPQQHQLLHPHQQQWPQQFAPLSAQGQRLPLPTHTLPALHPPALNTPLQAPDSGQTHLHAVAQQPCWCSYCTHFPHSPYWSQYSGGQLPR